MRQQITHQVVGGALVFGMMLGEAAPVLLDGQSDVNDTLHTPANVYVTLVSTPAMSGTSVLGILTTPLGFRAMYPQSVELLEDTVSKYIPPSPVSFSLKEL